MLLLLLVMLGAAWLGIRLLNRPFDVDAGLHPAIDFSSVWVLGPDSKSRPRAEYWGGLYFALCVGFCYCAWRKKDMLARNMCLWGLAALSAFPWGKPFQAFHSLESSSF